MRDLISRQVVMEYLQEQQANVIIERQKHGFVSQEVCDGMKAYIDAFINFIVQCPIGYNVEDVVEDLECYLEVTCELPENIVSEATDIVRKGKNI